MEARMESLAATELDVALSLLQLETTNNKAVLSYAAVLAVPLPPPSLSRPSVAPAFIAPYERRTAVIFQAACEKHRFVRNHDNSTIVERPERIRAVKMGVAAAWAGLEAKQMKEDGRARWEFQHGAKAEDELASLMGGLGIAERDKGKGKGKEVRGGPFDVLFSDAVMNIDDPSLHFIHGDPNIVPSSSSTSTVPPPTASTSTPSKRSPIKNPIPLPPPTSYARQLQEWCRASSTAIMTGPAFSEVPPHLSQGDLYLSPGSEEAILGALGATCEAVDRVCRRSEGYDRVFVAIRPPGHHCAEVDPSGFCWVNNVAVAAAHAHREHGISRVIIFDIDLHHGDGTQQIAWEINAAVNARRENEKARSPRKGSPKKSQPTKPDLQILYTSLHDIQSYPCEDGTPSLVQAASLNISGGHSQFITNVHLESWTDEEAFHRDLYPSYRDKLLGAAENFCRKTASDSEEIEAGRTLVFISAGFDASEHEGTSMSRHSLNVPTSFYHRFSTDVAHFANLHSRSNVVAVLEGGYSDRALASGSLALMIGLTEASRKETVVRSAWERGTRWNEARLIKMENDCAVDKVGKRATKLIIPPVFPPLATPSSTTTPSLLDRTGEIYRLLDPTELVPTIEPKPKVQLDIRKMQLRGRRVNAFVDEEETTPRASPAKGKPRIAAVRLTKSVISTPVAAKLDPVDVPELPASAPRAFKFTWKEGGVL